MNDSGTTTARAVRPIARRRRAHALVLSLAMLTAHACTEAPLPGIDAKFRGGPRGQGVYAPSGPAGRGVIEWSFETEGPVRASALVDSELVYIGSGDGNFYAIDRGTGHERWRFSAAGPIHSSAAARGDLVYFGDRSNAFYALDRRDGRLRWKVETGSDHPWAWGDEGWDYITSSPVVAGDQVIVGSGDGNVYAFDAETGAERWRVATGGRVRSSAAVADGNAYVGSADGFLYAIDLESGETRWRFATEGVDLSSAEFGFDRKTIQSSPAVADGTVLFGSRDGKFYAVDVASGELRWRYDNGMPWVVSSPAVFDSMAIVGSSDGLYVHALSLATGAEVWRFVTGNRVFASPALASDIAYVGNHAGRFLALDADSGALSWELRLNAAITSSAVVASGRIYVGCDDGGVYAVRLEAGPPPRRAVYWDEEREGWNTLAGHERVRDYFGSFGYEVVDRFQLSSFMQASIEDGAPSVIVFAMDDLPATVAPLPSDTVLARRYLDAGGKIVWLGLPPLMVARNAEGRITGVDRGRPAALLDIDLDGYNVDRYGAFPTHEGRRWGLADWWVGVSGIEAPGVTTVLALDEKGDASAWVKAYGGPPGSGFVFVWGTFEPLPRDRYEGVRRVAEYGIGIAADHR